MIIDGGSKTFSSDRPVNSPDVTFGQIMEAPGARFHKMNEEHGFVDITRAEREFSVGDRVHVIPNHICVAMNLHERVYGVRGDNGGRGVDGGRAGGSCNRGRGQAVSLTPTSDDYPGGGERRDRDDLRPFVSPCIVRR